MDLTLSSWVPNRDAQTGIMNLLLEGGFRRGKQRAAKMNRDSERGQSKRNISGLRQLLNERSNATDYKPWAYPIQLPKWFSKGLQPY